MTLHHYKGSFKLILEVSLINIFRYHIKYQYVGNLMKSEVEGIVCRLRLPLQKKLRFITQLSLAEVEAMNQQSSDPIVTNTNGTIMSQNNTVTVSQ